MENKIVMPQFRIGCGYDVHKLGEERKLILCGVEVPYEKGLLGHSDADVALHALMDALLGAAAMGDIGKHFPDTDERFKGADSMQLTLHVKKLLQEEGFIETVQGMGSQICRQSHFDFPVSQLTSYQEIVKASGLQSETNVIRLEKITIDEKGAKKLDFPFTA